MTQTISISNCRLASETMRAGVAAVCHIPAMADIDPKKLAIGRRIAEARKGKSLSQHNLAVQLGVTAGAVGQWEMGATLPKMEHFERLSVLLDVSREWLLTGGVQDEVRKAQTKAEETILRLSRHLSADQQSTLIQMLTGLAGPSEQAKQES